LRIKSLDYRPQQTVYSQMCIHCYKLLGGTKRGDTMNVEELEIMPDELDKAMDGLLGMFIWEESAEGHQYWQDVYDNMAKYYVMIHPEAGHSWPESN